MIKLKGASITFLLMFRSRNCGYDSRGNVAYFVAAWTGVQNNNNRGKDIVYMFTIASYCWEFFFINSVYYTSHYPVRKLSHYSTQDELILEGPGWRNKVWLPEGGDSDQAGGGAWCPWGGKGGGNIRKRPHQQTGGTVSLIWLIHVGHPGTSWPLRRLQ